MTIVTVDMQNPQPKDFLSVSQPKLLLINQQLDEQFGVDHVAFSDTSVNKGKHNKVTFVQQPDDPETIADEYCLFTKDSDGQPEIFARAAENATAFQVTKEGSLYLGALPFAVVNFDNAGAIQGTALNVSSVTKLSEGQYTINFTTASPDNNFFFSMNCQTADGAAVGMVTDPYSTSVTTTSFRTVWIRGSGLATIARAVVMIWRFQ